jgi:2-oxoacid:acceptor oxidoreductase delta subunit (pyruvate/2-ketoisovalerate family)
MGFMKQTEKSEIKGMIIVNKQNQGGRFVANWRTEFPLIDYDTCTACMLCEMYCPEAAIVKGVDGKPSIDLRFCKGCGICANECPQGTIETKEEAF